MLRMFCLFDHIAIGWSQKVRRNTCERHARIISVLFVADACGNELISPESKIAIKWYLAHIEGLDKYLWGLMEYKGPFGLYHYLVRIMHRATDLKSDESNTNAYTWHKFKNSQYIPNRRQAITRTQRQTY